MSPLDPTRLLAAVAAVHDRFVADHNDTARAEVLETALRGAMELTGSAVGFVARIRSGSAGPVLSPECVLALDPVRHAKVTAWLNDTLEASARGEQIPRPLAGALAEVNRQIDRLLDHTSFAPAA